MRFFFHVSDCARDTFDPDWRGKEFFDAEEALAHAQFLRSQLVEELELRGYIIVSDDNGRKVGVLVVPSPPV